MNSYKKIGVIADDFTGASDAASFLLKGGARVIMCNEIPDYLNDDFDALVIALKIRSIPCNEAVEQVKRALFFLKNQGCNCFYYKYCSTFDSTPEGNIGVVMDYLIDTLHVPYTVLCPSLPVNGRIVENGYLYVNGIPLDQSSMKNHPLNPMWDSYIPNLMKPQSHYSCEVIQEKQMNIESLQEIEKKHKDVPFYFVPDYKTDQDGIKIATLFDNLTLWSGGSGLLEYLTPDVKNFSCNEKQIIPNKPILLCGSCSQATKEQVQVFKDSGRPVISINSQQLLNGKVSVESVFAIIQQHQEPVLVYSDAINQDMNKLKEDSNFFEASQAMENFMAKLSGMAYKSGYDRIVVAGGETSGAVIKELGFKSFYIEKNVDPGVPVLRPLDSMKNTVILKSGNFGSRDFFIKAIH